MLKINKNHNQTRLIKLVMYLMLFGISSPTALNAMESTNSGKGKEPEETEALSQPAQKQIVYPPDQNWLIQGTTLFLDITSAIDWSTGLLADLKGKNPNITEIWVTPNNAWHKRLKQNRLAALGTHFPNITILRLSNVMLQGRVQELLNSFAKLEQLFLNDNDIIDLDALKKAPFASKLRVLDISNTSIISGKGADLRITAVKEIFPQARIISSSTQANKTNTRITQTKTSSTSSSKSSNPVVSLLVNNSSHSLPEQAPVVSTSSSSSSDASRPAKRARINLPTDKVKALLAQVITNNNITKIFQNIDFLSVALKEANNEQLKKIIRVTQGNLELISKLFQASEGQPDIIQRIIRLITEVGQEISQEEFLYSLTEQPPINPNVPQTGTINLARTLPQIRGAQFHFGTNI